MKSTYIYIYGSSFIYDYRNRILNQVKKFEIFEFHALLLRLDSSKYKEILTVVETPKLHLICDGRTKFNFLLTNRRFKGTVKVIPLLLSISLASEQSQVNNITAYSKIFHSNPSVCNYRFVESFLLMGCLPV